MSAGYNLLGPKGANFMANLAQEISRNQQKTNKVKATTMKVSPAFVNGARKVRRVPVEK
jgi:hypothetical protein